MSNLVEVVFVQLTDETGEVAVFKVLGKDMLRECFVLQLNVNTILAPAMSRLERTSSTTKLFPWSPQRTTFS